MCGPQIALLPLVKQQVRVATNLDNTNTYEGETLEALSGVDLFEAVTNAGVHVGHSLHIKNTKTYHTIC